MTRRELFDLGPGDRLRWVGRAGELFWQESSRELRLMPDGVNGVVLEKVRGSTRILWADGQREWLGRDESSRARARNIIITYKSPKD